MNLIPTGKMGAKQVGGMEGNIRVPFDSFFNYGELTTVSSFGDVPL
jgi:hypothetical protein